LGLWGIETRIFKFISMLVLSGSDFPNLHHFSYNVSKIRHETCRYIEIPKYFLLLTQKKNFFLEVSAIIKYSLFYFPIFTCPHHHFIFFLFFDNKIYLPTNNLRNFPCQSSVSFYFNREKKIKKVFIYLKYYFTNRLIFHINKLKRLADNYYDANDLLFNAPKNLDERWGRTEGRIFLE